MRTVTPWILLCVLALTAANGIAASKAQRDNPDGDMEKSESPFKAEQTASKGSVKVEGRRVDYDAYAGTIIVHPADWDDVPSNNEKEGDKSSPSEASMFYVAYIKPGDDNRPVTFIFNGGPGSATMWLHMGAFGPKRVLTAEDSHTPAAPYSIVNNDYSLLDASDLVFIDAPGAGFSRIAGKDRDKDFYGVDEDAHAFAEFISQFLSKYDRWNSPKYLFGESYGTTRSAALISVLQDRAIDFNGVIMLSQILMFDASADEPQTNPGVDLPFMLSLPTYAATAWYHGKLPGEKPALRPFLDEVERFAVTDYAEALHQGAALPAEDRKAIIEKLHGYTGLPKDYIDRANLRINGGQFEKTLLADSNDSTGRLDTRFSGPSINPLSEEIQYDPQASAISSAYYSALNDYVRRTLHYGSGKAYKPSAGVWGKWDFLHAPPGRRSKVKQATNVMPDLADAMKQNPQLKVMLNAGYFDLATPYFEGVYEMRHLPIPQKLQQNIEYAFYESGHMVYAKEDSLKSLHDKVADFIGRTSNLK
ncbi:MAG: hypothetical protein KDI19_02855 [Pseudomonadales bacterium]|nr:hypothetical protein [Pseudomonadales bacterium]